MESEQDKEKQNNSLTTKQIILYILIGILVLFVIYAIYRYITEIKHYRKIICSKDKDGLYYRGGYVYGDLRPNYFFSNYFKVIIGSLFRIGGKYDPYTYIDSNCETLSI